MTRSGRRESIQVALRSLHLSQDPGGPSREEEEERSMLFRLQDGDSSQRQGDEAGFVRVVNGRESVAGWEVGNGRWGGERSFTA